MQPIFLRTSGQLAQHLRDEIIRRTWVGRLPGERLLAERYQVARKTVRAALVELRHEGIVATRHGVGTEIRLPTSGVRSRESKLTTIGVLLPGPLIESRQHTALWLSRLADLLRRVGYQLELFHGTRYYSQSAGRALDDLITRHPAACWVLTSSTRYQQAWFVENEHPVVVAGSLFKGLQLPSVDINHEALCRHAAGLLIRAGHRRIALLYPKTGRPGDVESEDGFRQGCQRSKGVSEMVLRHDDTARSVYQTVQNLIARNALPTGLLVANSYSYLAIVSCLMANGRRIPSDVSVIARDADSFFSHLLPLPDCYQVAPEKFALKLCHAVMVTLKRGAEPLFTARLMPEYRRGGSLAVIR